MSAAMVLHYEGWPLDFDRLLTSAVLGHNKLLSCSTCHLQCMGMALSPVAHWNLRRLLLTVATTCDSKWPCECTSRWPFWDNLLAFFLLALCDVVPRLPCLGFDCVCVLDKAWRCLLAASAEFRNCWHRGGALELRGGQSHVLHAQVPQVQAWYQQREPLPGSPGVTAAWYAGVFGA